jgi:cell division protein FtsI/penicillin-binding protein 2
VSPRIERKVVDYPAIRAKIGKVKYISGRLVGISGYEQQFNQLLSGTPGKFRIMLDRNKNWIKNSGKSIKMATPAKDLVLPYSLEEIRLEKVFLNEKRPLRKKAAPGKGTER